MIKGKEKERENQRQKKNVTVFKDNTLQWLAMDHFALTLYHKQMKPLPQAGN